MLKTKKGSEDSSLGMYVHVPFCSTTCDTSITKRPSKKFDSRNGQKFQLDGSDHFHNLHWRSPGILSTDQLERLRR